MPLAALKVATAALLVGVSLLRFNKGGITLADVGDMGREYGVAALVGLVFGWFLGQGMDAVTRQTPESRRIAIMGIVTPLLALILSHQTRAFLNDGPITLALAVGLLFSIPFRPPADKERILEGESADRAPQNTPPVRITQQKEAT
ncbi:MAG: hypothetical protein HQK87_04085 [Nitrospinae bacterium]|nr:hypothetical protein [Nitrospinota bacterium]